MKVEKNVWFSAEGSVRGACGHHHRTAGAAETCRLRDGDVCASLGGGAYSDRNQVVRSDGASLTPDDEASVEAADQEYYGY
jgi:hypothetical protein